jgi:hypothetical protein
VRGNGAIHSKLPYSNSRRMFIGAHYFFVDGSKLYAIAIIARSTPQAIEVTSFIF